MEIIAQQICIILLKKKYSEDFESIPGLNEKLAVIFLLFLERCPNMAK